MDDLAPPPEQYQEMLTPRNLVLYVIIQEYFHMQHLLVDPTIALKDREKGLHDSNHKYLFYIHLLEMLDDEHVDPLASVRAGADSPLRKFLAKLVMMKLREFIPARLLSTPSNSGFLAQLSSGILSLQFYMAPETLTRLLSASRRAHNYEDISFAKNSVFGLFMRRVNLAFNSMPFEKSMLFMDRLVQYLMSGTEEECVIVDEHDKHLRNALREEAQELGGFQDEFDGTHSQPDWPEDEIVPFTQEQARDLVREQVRLLHVCPNGALPPVEMGRKLETYCRRFPQMPELSYLKYLNAMRTRDVCSAEHALHHFVGLKAADMSSGEASDSLYTYAALCAATLHKQLGHQRLAREAEQEALDKALLAKDGNLLLLMRSIHPLLNEQEKCPVLGEVDNNNSNTQTERKELSVIDLRHSMHDMYKNGSRPSELLLQFYLSLSADMAESTHVLNMELANLWDSYGFSLIADVFAQACLLYDPSRAHGGTYMNEAVVQALCRQLRRLDLLSGREAVSARHRHLLLLLQRNVRHPPQRQIVDRAVAEAEFDRAWLEGRGDAAALWIDALGLVSRQEADLRLAHLLRWRGNRQEAHRVADRLLLALPGADCPGERLSAAIRARMLLMEMALDARAPHLLSLHLGLCRESAERRYGARTAAWLDLYSACGDVVKTEWREGEQKMKKCKAELLAGGSWFEKGRIHFVDALVKLCRWKEERSEEVQQDAIRLLNTALENFEEARAVKRIRSTAALLSLIHDQRMNSAVSVAEEVQERSLRNRFSELAVQTEDRPDDSPEFEIVSY